MIKKNNVVVDKRSFSSMNCVLIKKNILNKKLLTEQLYID